MFISVRKIYKQLSIAVVVVLAGALCIYAKKAYQQNDFGNSFERRAVLAKQALSDLNESFGICSPLCNSDPEFMKAIVFPEVMRYNSLKDGIEAESLRTLYVQFGKEYADFSIGLFQMKPSFAAEVENKARELLPPSLITELQLAYHHEDEQQIRSDRVERMQDKEWQLVYLTAFIAICNELYKTKQFASASQKLQWFATIYNAGFDRTDAYLDKKVDEAHFYLEQDMPGKKFRYAAVAGWYYQTIH